MDVVIQTNNMVYAFSFIGAVFLHVYFQTARLCGGVVALFASERFLTSVAELVRLQGTILFTLVTALIAVKGRLSAVGEHVSLKGSRLCALIVALFAAEGLLSTMSTNVYL